MRLSKSRIINTVLVLFFSFWIWNSMQAFYISYISLLFLFSFQLVYYIGDYRSLIEFSSYENIFNIKYLGFLISAFTFFLVLTSLQGSSSFVFPIKVFFYLLIPIYFLAFSKFYSFFNSKNLLYIVFISFIFQVLFSFVIGYYDFRIGKVLDNREWFLFSSNNLSIYMVYTITVLGYVYYRYYQKNKLMLFFIFLLPVLHFSKAHLGAYFLSLILSYVVYRRKFITLLVALFFICSVSYFMYMYNEDLKLMIHNHSIQKILLGNELLVGSLKGDIDVSIWDFITRVGDGTRTNLFQVYTKALDETFWLGMGDKADVILLDGADYHNMYFFFHVQYGFFSFFFYSLILLYFLYLGVYKWKYLNYILIFSVLYFCFRSVFTVLDPYRILLFLILLTFIEKKLQYDESKNENPNDIRGKTAIYKSGKCK